MRRLLTVCFFFTCLTTPMTYGQELDVDKYRTYDGTFNNRENVNWGAAGDNLKLMVPLAYSDGMSAPAGMSRPNARELSNEIFTQLHLQNDPMKLSDFCWVWGQFLDHDVGITPDGNEFFPISVPKGDIMFDPFETGQVIIPMMRNRFDPATGTAVNNPRRHPNLITAYIDGSGVYGSDLERADWLRTFQDGKLKVSEGDLLPYNTTTGQYEDPVDEHAPEMDDAVGRAEKLFVAGDVRANENPLLIAFHTLFVREHNRMAEELKEKNPDWNDEQLYQHARKMVGAFIQAIVYEEYLPAIGVHLDEYQGYDINVNAQLANIFTAAAFRLGHTLLNGNLMRVMNDGTEHPDGPITLRDAFFNPDAIKETGGIDPFLKGMGVQMQQQLDARIIDDVRNFLFGAPGAGGLDLASINITRGRERGLPDYNAVRKALGLREYSIFREINLDNIGVTYDLLTNYLNIDNVDPWVGMLAEKPMPGALFGETIMEIMHRQFTELRDGDRFYYLNDPVLSEEEKAEIKKTTLHDIIMRNTTITLMQDDVFAALPHAEICANMTVEVLGQVYTELGNPVADVGIDLETGKSYISALTSKLGAYSFDAVPGCDSKSIRFNKDDSHANGLSTLDLILVQKHILNRDPLDTPYRILSADVDNSGSVSTLDLIKMRKVILSIDLTLNDDTAWEFIPEHFTFTDERNPFIDEIPTTFSLDEVGVDFAQNFIAIKLGDVNGSANPGTTNALSIEARSSSLLELNMEDVALKAGQQTALNISASALKNLMGYQFGLRFDPEAIRIVDLKTGDLPGLEESNFGIFNEEGLLTTSWNDLNGEWKNLKTAKQLFTIVVEAQVNKSLSQVLYLDSRNVKAEAYNKNLEVFDVGLNFVNPSSLAGAFEVYQNQPNPFNGGTNIPFLLPEAAKVQLSVFDVSGKQVYQMVQAYDAGYQEWRLNTGVLPGSGIYYYRLSNNKNAVTKKMVITE